MRSSARNRLRGLYLVYDPAFTGGRGVEEVIGGALAGGARVVQLRAKGLPAREAYALAVKTRELTLEAGALFIVNDSVEIALACGADGVHLGQDDFPAEKARALMGSDAVIGVSTHNIEEALSAEAGGADYIGFGPVYETKTKVQGETAKGPEGVKAIRDRVDIPVVAIGGIDAGNVKAVIEAGADAVAVITAVTMAEDIEAAALAISRQFQQV